MDEQTQLTVHFLVSKLVLFAVPLLNQVLLAFGITVTTSNSTPDALANMLCIGVGLAYSWWAHQKAVKSMPPISSQPSTLTPPPSTDGKAIINPSQLPIHVSPAQQSQTLPPKTNP